MPTGADLLAVALTQIGRRYIYAAQPSPAIANPPAFDCSGFTRWVAGRCGITIPLGSWIQKSWCQARGGLISLDQARGTPGALIGHDGQGPEGHVAMVASHDLTMEARGAAYGVNQFPISGRPFQWGLLIPGVDYSTGNATPIPQPSSPSSTHKETDVVKVPGGTPNATFGNRFAYWSVKGKQIIGYNGAPIMGGNFGLGVSYIDVPAAADLTGLCLDEDGVTLIASCNDDGGTFTYRWR